MNLEGTNIQSYAKSDKVYLIPQIIESVNLHDKYLPMIHSVTFNIPSSRIFTCPVSTLMAFSSLNQEDNLDIINSFHNSFEIEQVMQVSNEIGLHPVLNEREDFSEITFNDRNRPVAPLFWARVKSVYDLNRSFNVDLNYDVFARHFYLLLIDAYRRMDNSIDCGDVRPRLNLIKIRS